MYILFINEYAKQFFSYGTCKINIELIPIIKSCNYLLFTGSKISTFALVSVSVITLLSTCPHETKFCDYLNIYTVWFSVKIYVIGPSSRSRKMGQ